MSIQTAAADAEKILEDVMRVEPTIATMAGIFGGPALGPVIATIQPEVLAVVPYVEQALKAVAGGDYSGSLESVIAVIKHLVPGQPNAPALSPTAPVPDFQAPQK